MFRPFLFAFLFFATGIVAGEHAGALWLFGLMLACALSLYFFTGDLGRALCLGIALFALGALYHNFYSGRVESSIANYAGSYRTVIGTVVSPPEIDGTRVSYEVRTRWVLEGERLVEAPGKIRVTAVLGDGTKLLSYGDLAEFSGMLKIPTNYDNPGGFDYRAYLAQKGITATLFSREIKYLGEGRANPLVKTALSFRERIRHLYRRSLPPRLASLLTGIVLGLKGDIPADVLEAFGDGGVLHILTASGYNVGIIYGSVHWLLDFLKIPRKAGFIAGSAAVLFYSLMAGMAPPVLRAAIMLEVVMYGKLIGRKSDPLNSLGFAGLILLLANSYNIFSASFQLSFAATAGLILFFDRVRSFFEKFPTFFRDSLAATVSAQLLLLPFQAYYFRQVSLVGFLLNLAVVPLSGAALIGGFLGGMTNFLPFLAGPIVKIAGILVFLMDRMTDLAAKLPYATLPVPSLGPALCLVYFAMLYAVFAPAENLRIVRRYRWAVAGLCLLVLMAGLILRVGGFEVTFLDVGQGDAVFIKTGDGRAVLIDGGGMPAHYKGDFDVGKHVVLPYLYGRGVRRLDAVVFTHFDSDHAEGLLSVIEEMKTKAIIIGRSDGSEIYRRMVEIAERRKIPIYAVSRGDVFRIGDAAFYVLNPSGHHFFEDDNDNSVVLKMVYRGLSFLFTGDLGFDGEKDLIADCDVSSDVLKVAHHGSATSTSEEFLKKVNPKIAVISAGENNNFGHPSARVLKLLEENKIKVFRTDLHGAVSFKLRGNRVEVYTHKADKEY